MSEPQQGRLFICWSKERSKRMAEMLHETLKEQSLGLDSFVSTVSIESGKPWFTEVEVNLREAHDVLVCVTPENCQSHWMHFEAGFVASRARRVFVYCLPGATELLDGPISQYQVNIADKKGTEALFAAVSDKTEIEDFDELWEKHLERTLEEQKIPDMNLIVPELANWFQRKTFDEPINECPDQSWLDRYFGARETHARLVRQHKTIEECCAEHQLWLYDKLVAHVDAYVRIFERYLLRERIFDVADNGTVDFGRPVNAIVEAPKGNIHTIVERRCRAIRHVLFCLTDPAARPVLPEAPQFARFRLKEFDDRKKMIQGMDIPKDPDTLGRCRASYWDYDRIAYHRYCESRPQEFNSHCEAAEKELELAEAYEEPVTRMPLHYALRALAHKMERPVRPPGPTETQRILRLCESVKQFLVDQGDKREKKITGVIGRILDQLGNVEPT